MYKTLIEYVKIGWIYNQNKSLYIFLYQLKYLYLLITNKHIIIMKKALRHYEQWAITESLQFLNSYLDGVKNQDQNVLCREIADELDRTYYAVKIRVLEVHRILTGERDFPTVSPNMVKAVQQILKERNLSIGRAELLF